METEKNLIIATDLNFRQNTGIPLKKDQLSIFFIKVELLKTFFVELGNENPCNS
jgi:hypothetical protein